MQMKCPYCGSEAMHRANSPESSTMHVLTTVTKTANGLTFHPDKGIPVNVIYCGNCKMVSLELTDYSTQIV